jgi:hypothetical protein
MEESTMDLKRSWTNFRRLVRRTKDKPPTVPPAMPRPLSRNDDEIRDRRLLLREIAEAKRNWQIAQQKLDYVTEPDQIDYAIFALEAAEKRYEMLLRQAKRMRLSAAEEESGRWLVGSNGLEA